MVVYTGGVDSAIFWFSYYYCVNSDVAFFLLTISL